VKLNSMLPLSLPDARVGGEYVAPFMTTNIV
jgi:hypothetical protein